MKLHSSFFKVFVSLSVTIALLIPVNVFAKKLTIVTTYSYIASITQQITGNSATITALAPAQFDPHFIVPKPSYIAKIRKADLLIINGAQLEIGWLPPLLRQANNPRIQTGESGFLDLSQFVTKIQVPQAVSRAQGDIHPEGNPHFCLDPYNIPLLAKAIYERLTAVDPQNTPLYTQNYTVFLEKWKEKLSHWDTVLKPLSGKAVIEYHKLYDYFFQRYSLYCIATIEPIPGIPPTSKHIKSIESLFAQKKVSFILQDVYHSDDAAHYLSKKYGVPLIILPHDVNATADAQDIFALFDALVRRLTQ